MTRRILILGGTGEAVALARLLESRAEFDVITSLAGRTRRPAAVPGHVRTGGFGGATGLAAWLEAERVDALVDATHPYAATISRHAAQACDARGAPRVQLWRPAWVPAGGDAWIEVPDLNAAADAVADSGITADGSVFLTTGARDVQAFRRQKATKFLVRLVDVPQPALPLARCELIIDRGPFAVETERALLREHRVELLVSKNSGGAATYPKLAAARELQVPVVMVRRPDPEPGARVDSAEAALRWLTGVR